MENENIFTVLFVIWFIFVIILFSLLLVSQERERKLECVYWQLEKEYIENLDLNWHPCLGQIEQCLPFNINLQ